MKIEIEVPDWVKGTNIYVFSNFELAARKMVNREWEQKVVRCTHCGTCCKQLDEGHVKKGILPIAENGDCGNLEQRADGTYWCKYHIPIFCLTSNPAPERNCPVEWD